MGIESFSWGFTQGPVEVVTKTASSKIGRWIILFIAIIILVFAFGLATNPFTMIMMSIGILFIVLGAKVKLSWGTRIILICFGAILLFFSILGAL